MDRAAGKWGIKSGFFLKLGSLRENPFSISSISLNRIKHAQRSVQTYD